MISIFLQNIELFKADLWDAKDFMELLFRFCINLFFAFIVIRSLYYPLAKRKDYLFTYFLLNIVIFFVCTLLSSVKLSMGFAFGLFAIFGILRYRTEALPIKEMTYLFIIIAIAIINALANKKISYAELGFTNIAIVAAVYLIEKAWFLTHEVSRSVLYEKIELIKPEHQEALIADLKERTGLDIHRIKIGKIDFLRDVADIKVYYYQSQSERFA
ncbi:MAG: hypothetical protein ACJAY8_000408 [Sphingobacteriales bacterium]|jgi:hypothetical protein